MRVRIRDGMSTKVLTVGPQHTLAQVAAMMSERNIGSAVVLDPDGEGPGIITERDVLRSVAQGRDPTNEVVADYAETDLTVAHPDWGIERAAATMIRAGFRHLVVCDDDSEVAGVVSMRDIVRLWVAADQEGAV
ncbi:MAG: CBS domain-containing protein [Jiangellaceae bacterium]